MGQLARMQTLPTLTPKVVKSELKDLNLHLIKETRRRPNVKGIKSRQNGKTKKTDVTKKSSSVYKAIF